MAPRLQNPVHLGDTLFYVFEIPYSECGGDGVERVVRIGQCRAVLVFERDVVRQSRFSDFLPSDFHHALRDVGPDDAVGFQAAVHGDGQIPRTCGDIENRGGRKRTQESDSFPAPYFVDTQRERMVQLIVCTGDGVKHAPDLCRFVLLVVVG